MKLGDYPASIDEILSGPDACGLLNNVAPVRSAPKNPRDVAAQNFLDIVEFYDRNGREPCREAGNQERLLAIRLAAYRANPALAQRVRIYDRYGLLGEAGPDNDHNYRDEPDKQAGRGTPDNVKDAGLPQNPKSTDDLLRDIFANASAGLLDEMDPSVYDLAHIGEKAMPDEIASRKPCADFYRFEKMFLDIHKSLKTRAAIACRYRSRHGAAIGSVFILRGLLCHVAGFAANEANDGGPGKTAANPRLRVVFENATETDLLKNSLIRALFKDPVAKFVDLAPGLFNAGALEAVASKRPTGYIYILESLCRNPLIARLRSAGQLVKIGYCAQEVEERVKNARFDPTFLEAPVRIRARFTCYNLDPRRFERLVHAFLHNQRLCVELRDKDGAAYRPREWFTVDWRTAAEVCSRIIDGSIGQYRMDNANLRLVRK